MDPHGEDEAVAVAEQFDVREQLRRDAIRDQAGDPLLGAQPLRDAQDVPRTVLNPNEHRAAGGVRERDHRARQAVRRREGARELERLACVPQQESGQVHGSEN